MVKLESFQGFSADLAAAVCLMISSVFGLPVSTTHTKTTAIMGVGAAKRFLPLIGQLLVKCCWLGTYFPGMQPAVGFIMAWVFMQNVYNLQHLKKGDIMSKKS